MRPRLPRPRSLQNRLTLLFLAITALSFAAVIFFFLPQLQSRVEEQSLRDLERVARSLSPRIAAVMGRDVTSPNLDQLVRAVADSAQGRVTLLGVQQSSSRQRPQFYVISDSNELRVVRPDYALATSALRRGDAGASATRRTRRAAEVAVPLRYRGKPVWVAIYSRPSDAAEIVRLVRTRLLEASAVALLIALVSGFFVARALALRVSRLERAARAVAAGREVRPLPVDSSDELGRLTRTFNEMQAQLARVDRARKEFIANASHELRTPIFSLGGFVELLQDEQLDTATRDEFLGLMRQQVDRLQKLAVDLLDLSRLDAGSLELHSEEVDLGELAHAVAEEFKPAVAQHGTALELHVPDEHVAARCDRERVAQIMRILLDNALRHTPRGTTVTVSARSENGAAEFAVADSGPGIDAAARAQLFERFYTADAASGSGLGLAIARELAERMEGRIELLSRPGRTVFTLELPASG
ncbi:MAG TPA: ATP-binding protein [Thermoleophilaceae bacterium]|jgi:signal transduction histidine kinase